MRKSLTLLLSGAALAAVAGAADAQTYGYPGYGQPGYGAPPYGQGPGYGGADTAVLFEYPNFQGRSIVVTRENGNLDGVGFNDRTGSARLEGSWRLCEDKDYRGRCETVTGSIPNLSYRGIKGLSSLQVT